MKKQTHRLFKIIAILSFVSTVTWVVLTAVSMSQVKPSWSDDEYLKWISDPGLFYIMNYINATVLTILVIALFTVLFHHLYERNNVAGLLGYIFVPIYGVINLVCYSIQISVVPWIADNAINTAGDIAFVLQLIQSRSGSVVGFLNGFAYAILGIPSIIYGYLLIKERKKYSGFFLLINGVLCIIGVIGYMFKNALMSAGIVLGGIAFLVSLAFMVFEFRNVEKKNV